MRALECAWEPEMLRAIREGRWPERCKDDLREHLAACGTCAELIEVAVALARDRDSAVRSAPVPGSGVVWWRTQLRMRREAERRAQLTVTLVQGAILGACSILALVVLGWVSTPPLAWLEPFASGVDGAGPAAITHAIPWSNRIFLVLVAWLFLILAALRLALTDDAAGPLLLGPARRSAPRPLAPTARPTSSSPARCSRAAAECGASRARSWSARRRWALPSRESPSRCPGTGTPWSKVGCLTTVRRERRGCSRADARLALRAWEEIQRSDPWMYARSIRRRTSRNGPSGPSVSKMSPPTRLLFEPSFK